ncbi:MAG: paraquat-inducible protein A, partial [Candidatus Margulisbacteria bacterium]|nr:paraquat-inducible protein A [Candidatus Margulisiibacteriota bacterium]
SLMIISLTAKYGWKPGLAIFLFRWMREIKPWGMLEVFMLGILGLGCIKLPVKVIRVSGKVEEEFQTVGDLIGVARFQVLPYFSYIG